MKLPPGLFPLSSQPISQSMINQLMKAPPGLEVISKPAQLKHNQPSPSSEIITVKVESQLNQEVLQGEVNLN